MIKLDDGTGLLDLLVTSSAAAAPGSDAASVGPGAYVLVQGRLQARPQPGGAALEYSVKVQKVGAGWPLIGRWVLGVDGSLWHSRHALAGVCRTRASPCFPCSCVAGRANRPPIPSHPHPPLSAPTSCSTSPSNAARTLRSAC